MRKNAYSPSDNVPNMGGQSAPVVESFMTDPTVTGSADGGVKAGSEDAEARKTLRYAAASIIGALVLLWLFGGIVFRDANL